MPQGLTSHIYDAPTGHLKTITGPGGESVDYVYDGALMVSSTMSGTVNATVERAYDSDFRIAGLSLNGAPLASFTYDADGLLAHAGLLSLTRDPQNGLIAATQLASVSDSYTYNGFGEVTLYNATAGSTSAYAVTYTRDDLGRIATKTETIGGATTGYGYAYDFTGRLTDVRTNGTITAHYDYDANGNRVHAQNASGAADATYDAQDRLLTYGSQSFVYTPNGELSVKTDGGGVTTYGYDAFGNLTRVQLADGNQIDYVIDAFGRRIGKKRNGALVQAFVYQGQLQPIAEIDGAGHIVSQFVYAAHQNVPEYVLKGGTTYRFVHDQLGSVRLVVDASSGAVAQRIDYDEFGNVLVDTKPGFQPFGFAGGIFDSDTKLVHFGAREYDAQIGRWTTIDPLVFRGHDANFFAYVENDPINFIDSAGLMKLPPDPSGLPPDWTPDPTHQDPRPGNVRYRHPSGDTLDFHPGRPGAGVT